MNISALTWQTIHQGDEPTQSLGIAQETDQIQHGVWECGPGELDLHFAYSETVFILEGRAEVENQITGELIILEPGTMALFQKGSHWVWRIPWRLKKVFTIIV